MSSFVRITKSRGFDFKWGTRTYLMGIINATPDSFSGDGIALDVDAAVELAQRFIDEGADILDVGGESTRPGHTPVSIEDELRRVVPVIDAVAKKTSLPISVDTYKPRLAIDALEAGASMLNDIWGLKRSPELAQIAADYHVPIVLMHNREGHDYQNLMAEIIADLKWSVEIATKNGVALENIIVDPGIGFGKTWDQNLEVIRHLGELKSLGLPLLIGTSRKSFIGRVLDLPVEQRVEGTAATVALAIAAGVDMVRVHDVKTMVRVARMVDAVVRATPFPRPLS